MAECSRHQPGVAEQVEEVPVTSWSSLSLGSTTARQMDVFSLFSVATELECPGHWMISILLVFFCVHKRVPMRFVLSSQHYATYSLSFIERPRISLFEFLVFVASCSHFWARQEVRA